MARASDRAAIGMGIGRSSSACWAAQLQIVLLKNPPVVPSMIRTEISHPTGTDPCRFASQATPIRPVSRYPPSSSRTTSAQS
jgi:hypothetical protein